MPKQNSTNSNHIGQRIKELRRKKKLSQSDLAHLVGCTQGTVAEWERRQDRAPGKKYRKRVAQVLEVSLDYLCGMEELEVPQLPYYGEVSSEEFIWPKLREVSYVEVPTSEYTPHRFILKIIDDLLEPVIYKGDYGILEKLPPKNGDIVVVRFPQNKNKAMIKMWRQKGKHVMLSEINLNRLGEPYFFEIISQTKKNLNYSVKNSSKYKIIIEGKLVGIKREVRSMKTYLGIRCVYS